MRFLIDANIRHSVGIFLEKQGHDVRFLAGTSDRALADEDVLLIAAQERRIILTNDKDFGTLIFHRRRKHAGIMLFRLNDESAEHYQMRLEDVFSHFGNRLEGHFAVVTDFHIRFR